MSAQLPGIVQWSGFDRPLRDLLERYIALHGATLSEASQASMAGRMVKLERTMIGGCSVLDLQLSELTPIILQELHDRIVVDARTMGERCLGMIRRAWAWGAAPSRGLVPPAAANPVLAVHAPRPKAQVPEISGEVVAALWVAANDEKLRMKPQMRDFMRGLLLGGFRPWSEFLVMKASQIFRTRNGWAVRLPSTKTGRKVRGIGTRLAEILLAQREIVGPKGYLWPPLGPGATHGHMSKNSAADNWAKLVRAASERVDIDERLYPYMARHGVATAGIECGATLVEVGAMLGHTSLQSTLHYVHGAPTLEARVADQVASHIIDGADETPFDLAAEIGTKPTFGAMREAVRVVCVRFGVERLVDIEKRRMTVQVDPDKLSANTRWNHRRFLLACKWAGIADAEELNARILELRTKRWREAGEDGEPPKAPDRRTTEKWWRDQMVPERLIWELADTLGVQADWLMNRVRHPRPTAKPVEGAAA